MVQPGSSSEVVGRSRELADLESAFSGVVDGRGQLTLVDGEAGIGKTTLVQRFSQSAGAAGASVLFGACFDFEQVSPFGPWFEALATSATIESSPLSLEQVRPGGAVPNFDELRERIFRFLTDAAKEQPVVLILEDMHWADEASIGLLRFVSRRVASHRIMIVASYRDTDLIPESPLFRAIPDLIRESTPLRIHLAALKRNDVGTIIDRRYSLNAPTRRYLLDYLVANAEGNPFFIVELLRSLEVEGDSNVENQVRDRSSMESIRVPLVIRQVLERNLARLPTPALTLLDAATVIGSDVSMDMWQAVAGCDDVRLSECIEAAMRFNILLEVPGCAAFRFRHALIRRTLYERIPLPQRRTLHRRAAELLMQTSRPNVESVAHHLWRANDERAVEWLSEAGRRASEMGAPSSAILDYDRAIEIAESVGNPVPIDLFKGRAAAHATIGNFIAAIEDYHSVLDYARARKHRYDEWDALIGLGVVWGARDYTRSGEYFRQALQLTSSIDDPSVEAQTLGWMGNWHLNVGNAPHAITAHIETLRLYEQLGDQIGAARTQTMIAMDHIVHGDMESTAMYARRAASTYRSRNQLRELPDSLALVLSSAGVCSFSTERPSSEHLIDQRGAAEEAISAACRTGWRAGESFARITYATYLVIRGEVDQAESLLSDAAGIAEEIGHREWLALAEATRGDLALEIMELDAASRHLERGWALANEISSFIHRRIVGDVLVRQRTLLGKFTEAEQLLSTLLEEGAGMGTDVERGCWRARAGLDLATGQNERALSIADELVLASTPPDLTPAPHLSALRGSALFNLQRYDEALAAFDRAQIDAELYGYLPLLARVRQALADTNSRMGRPERAAQWQQQSIETARRIGDSIANDDRRERFLKSMTPRDKASPGANAGLTRREVDVLTLVASGMTNIQIADQLFISPRTVKGHLESIFNKLNVDSRTAAAAHAYKLGLVHPISADHAQAPRRG